MDQFTYAERATDWRANNNIADSIYQQMRREPHPCPAWLVSSAGTGGTLATLGRYARYCQHPTRVCGVDAERSVFFDYYLKRDCTIRIEEASRIEGIGRPRVEASFLPDVIDAMVKVPDRWSIAAMREVSRRLGRSVGGSTGTNLIAALACMEDMRRRGQSGSVVTILCDSGSRYAHTYYSPAWLSSAGLDGEREQALLRASLDGAPPDAELEAVLNLATRP
jgi:cysteine synthase A